ncbi:MAG TPA: hydrogenase maturation nickel metallochaperone HypA [Anaerolineae bacterium]|nr:hydrogenase maturation nickel metallochaperone HypA [Anaerolineae bacterium]
MHELAITRNILDIALNEAEKHGAKRITAIHLKVGALTSVVPECVEFYLEVLAKGTIAEGVRLETTIVPLTAHCHKCDLTFPVEDNCFLCPRCGGAASVVSGRELYIESLEVE